MKIMITNGGKHPAEAWAQTTSDSICDLISVKPDSVTPKAIAAREELPVLKKAIYDKILPHYQQLQQQESGLLEGVGPDHLLVPYDPRDRASKALSEINEAFSKTMFAESFAMPAPQDVLMRMLCQHFTTALHVERSWYANKTPDNEICQAFLAQQHGILPSAAA